MLKSDLPNIDKEYYFNVILDENRHMNELVGKLLSVSQLENGLTELQCENIDLSEICEKIVDKNQLINEKIAINFTKSTDLAIIFAEKLRIEQVVSNFVSNAYNYAKTNVAVNLEKIDNNFRVSVENDGENINQDDFEKIWHSFYRADKARTRNDGKNFGLGLYIVKTIISAHGGTVGVENTDNGVCFWFELPCVT